MERVISWDGITVWRASAPGTIGPCLPASVNLLKGGRCRPWHVRPRWQSVS